mmetsp:Transcript_54591/g.97433  ORF Transcript_54591/g.97433 Transcript_54591/m.97433 type:complete len:211 (+) Transcript_54591:81-713(+)
MSVSLAASSRQVTSPLLPAAALHRFRQGAQIARSPQAGSPCEVLHASPEKVKQQPPLLPSAALYRCRSRLSVPGRQSPPAGVQKMSDPTPRLSRKQLSLTVPSSPGDRRIQISPGGRQSPQESSSEGPTTRSSRGLVMSLSPVGPVLSYVATGGHPIRSVRFSSPLNTEHEITPYKDFYGTHPDCFDFDAEGNMIVTTSDSWSPLSLTCR